MEVFAATVRLLGRHRPGLAEQSLVEPDGQQHDRIGLGEQRLTLRRTFGDVICREPPRTGPHCALYQ
jgi:hypothetical protein